jgi:surfeit locus 1 family protein
VGLLLVFAALVFSIFAALGTWQIERRHWKLDLIARVNQRVHADAVAAPSTDQWRQLNAPNDEYRRIRVIGTFMPEHNTLVQAVTALGSGFWVLTPLRLTDGTAVMVNRGFISAEAKQTAAVARVDDTTTSNVTGLLRMTQPGGAFLHQNDPINNRWYSRDVFAIAAAKGLTQVAPYFVDADASLIPTIKTSASNPDLVPIGGLTVITFHNNHLVYALTWYTLATMVAGAMGYFAITQRQLSPHLKSKKIDRVADN